MIYGDKITIIADGYTLLCGESRSCKVLYKEVFFLKHNLPDTFSYVFRLKDKERVYFGNMRDIVAINGTSFIYV